MTTTTYSPDLALVSVSPPATRSSGKLQLCVLRDKESILTSRDSWNELAGHHPFMRWEWIASWWQAFESNDQAAVLVVRDSIGRWVGLFPLQIVRRPFRGRVLTVMAHDRACSDHVRPIFAPENERESIRLMSQWIASQVSQRTIDLIDFDGVDSDDPVVEKLLEPVVAAGVIRRDSEIEGSWIAKLPEDWSAFERQTKKCFRRKMQKARRNKEAPGISIRTLTSPADIREHWSSFIRLHDARQDQKNQVGCFQQTGFAEFLLRATERMAEQGDAILMFAEHDRNPFGTVLLFIAGNRAFMYQSGFEPSMRAWEPGHLMATCAVQHAIERGCTHFDFLRGDEPYKARWNTVRQSMRRIRLIPNHWKGRFRLAAWNVVQSVSARLKAIRTKSSNPETANVEEADAPSARD